VPTASRDAHVTLAGPSKSMRAKGSVDNARRVVENRPVISVTWWQVPSIVSHAQYGEDLVLWGALCDVDQGCYIDVGAADPTAESVTKLFYDRGWSGINIEPRPKGFAAIVAQRPRDITLQIAASDQPGSLTLHEIADQPGLSTLVAEFADGYASSGMARCSYEVPARPLAAVCAEYAPGEIHFLKIDVEGAERSVLLGCDFSLYRPWLLAIESTVPCTYAPNHEEWEQLVLAAGYEFALYHKINRYYVAREHSDRIGRVQVPPLADIAIN
jgi:FkbM family methyltransferase